MGGGRASSPGVAEFLPFVDPTIAVLGAAQQPSGYLNSFYQNEKPDEKLTDLR